MKLFLYKLLTQAIVILGWLRERLRLTMEIRRDRTFIDSPLPFSIVCCDCGLAHFYKKVEDQQVQQPIRPLGYDYSLRYFSVGSSPFMDESESEVV